MSLTWTENLAVGFGLIDEQHRELFIRYNSLLQACKQGQGREALAPMLDFLIAYVAEHFAEEERFMARFAYPAGDEHRQQHRDLIRQVEAVRRELAERGATVAVTTTINHTLCNWLINHVKQTDVRLGRFLAAQSA